MMRFCFLFSVLLGSYSLYAEEPAWVLELQKGTTAVLRVDENASLRHDGLRKLVAANPFGSRSFSLNEENPQALIVLMSGENTQTIRRPLKETDHEDRRIRFAQSIEPNAVAVAAMDGLWLESNLPMAAPVALRAVVTEEKDGRLAGSAVFYYARPEAAAKAANDLAAWLKKQMPELNEFTAMEVIGNEVRCVFAPEFLTHFNRAETPSTIANIKMILVYFMLYCSDHEDAFPAALAELTKKEYNLKPETLLAREDAATKRWDPAKGPLREENTSFAYLGKGIVIRQVRFPSRTPIVFEKPQLLKGDKLSIGYVDGHVAQWTIPPGTPRTCRGVLEAFFKQQPQQNDQATILLQNADALDALLGSHKVENRPPAPPPEPEPEPAWVLELQKGITAILRVDENAALRQSELFNLIQRKPFGHMFSSLKNDSENPQAAMAFFRGDTAWPARRPLKEQGDKTDWRIRFAQSIEPDAVAAGAMDGLWLEPFLPMATPVAVRVAIAEGKDGRLAGSAVLYYPRPEVAAKAANDLTAWLKRETPDLDALTVVEIKGNEVLCAFAPGFLAHFNRADNSSTITNVKQILLGCMMYTIDYRDAFPESLMELARKNYLTDPEVYLARGETKAKRWNMRPESPMSEDNVSFAYLAKGLTSQTRYPSEVPALFEKPQFYSGNTLHVGYMDGHVSPWMIPPGTPRTCRGMLDALLSERIPAETAAILRRNADALDALISRKTL